MPLFIFHHCHQDSAVMLNYWIELCVFCLRFSNTALLCSGWQHQANRFKSECVIFGDQRSRFLRFYFACPEHFLGNINTTSENYNLEWKWGKFQPFLISILAELKLKSFHFSHLMSMVKVLTGHWLCCLFPGKKLMLNEVLRKFPLSQFLKTRSRRQFVSLKRVFFLNIFKLLLQRPIILSNSAKQGWKDLINDIRN